MIALTIWWLYKCTGRRTEDEWHDSSARATFFVLDTYWSRVQSPTFLWFLEGNFVCTLRGSTSAVSLKRFEAQRDCGYTATDRRVRPHRDIQSQLYLERLKPDVGCRRIKSVKRIGSMIAGFNLIGLSQQSARRVTRGLYLPVFHLPCVLKTDATPIRVVSRMVLITFAKWSHMRKGQFVSLTIPFRAPAQAPEMLFNKAVVIATTFLPRSPRLGFRW
ncbi:hypothetical protein BDQ17DRAFT_1428989 [Cyathus striatus]|nr:hypothetical protein BDQ17DRAFT_1428989 [Cyathus striatus]